MSRSFLMMAFAVACLWASSAIAVTVNYQGIPHTTVGTAIATVVGSPPSDQLVVSNIGSSGEDGVVAELPQTGGPVESYFVNLDLQLLANGDAFSMQSTYDILASDIYLMVHMDQAPAPPVLLIKDDPTSELVEIVLRYNELSVGLISDRDSDQPLGRLDSAPASAEMGMCDDSTNFSSCLDLKFEIPITFTLLPENQDFTVDQITIKKQVPQGEGAEATAASASPGSLLSVTMTAANVPSFTLLGASITTAPTPTPVPALGPGGVALAMLLLCTVGWTQLLRTRDRRLRRTVPRFQLGHR